MSFAKKLLLPSFFLLKSLSIASPAAAASVPNDLLNHVKHSIDSGNMISVAFYGQQANGFYEQLAPDLPFLFHPPATHIGHVNLFNCEKNALCQVTFDQRQLTEPARLSNGVLTYTYEAPLPESAMRLKVQLTRTSPWVVALQLDVDILKDGVFQAKHSLSRGVTCKLQQGNTAAPASKCLIQALSTAVDYPLAASVTPAVYSSSKPFFVSLQGDAAVSLFAQMRSAHATQDSIEAELSPERGLEVYRIADQLSCFESYDPSIFGPVDYRCHILYEPHSILTSTLNPAGFQLELTPKFKNSLLTEFKVDQNGKEIFQDRCLSAEDVDVKRPYSCIYASGAVQIQDFDPVFPPKGHAVIGGWNFKDAPPAVK